MTIKNKQRLIKDFLKHPDLQEIISKYLVGVDTSDIYDWLKVKYSEIDKQGLIISKKTLQLFKDEYLDIYAQARDDLLNIKQLQNNPNTELQEHIQNNPLYFAKLNEHIEKEIDIKSIVRRLVINIQTRAAQVFDKIQEDPDNVKMDKTLIEWFNTLTNILEKYDNILNGPVPDVNIQNNINIQVLDKHMEAISNVIREILSKLDYDTSLLFIELFNEQMKKIKETNSITVIPVEERLLEAQKLEDLSKE